MRKISLILGVVLVVLASSCKKKEDPKPVLEYLTGTTSKTWKVNKVVVKQGTAEVDLLSGQKACDTDNLLVLFTDKSYEFREGATKCDAGNPDLILKSSWVLNETEKSINISKFVFLGRTIENAKLVITDINDNSFTGTTDIQFNGTTYSGVITFAVVK
ncbi:hypothetical protein GVN16_18780 [Emticicia sp. CRIBPO]|uniref:hypothetical protein n=1 Tax=Emticicia sp. CRIBPO TaxID=2683258 RepID=UPI00141335C7|nr:hypothetical protein [Emticicia sp. CRIBPO]NBA87822.1 hypothetical protein [Emticicia sp. CRIBPO]